MWGCSAGKHIFEKKKHPKLSKTTVLWKNTLGAQNLENSIQVDHPSWTS